VRNGYAFLYRIGWEPYTESEDLIPQAIKYKQDRNFCSRNNIRLSGKRLGRPSKNPVINEIHKQQLSADQRRRNEVEGVFGSGKRKYSLRLIMARLAKGAETSISMAVLVIFAVYIRSLLRLFFAFSLLGFTHRRRPYPHG